MSIVARVGVVIVIWYAILLPLRLLTLRRALPPWVLGATGFTLGVSASLVAVAGLGSVLAGAAVVATCGLIGLVVGALVGHRLAARGSGASNQNYNGGGGGGG